MASDVIAPMSALFDGFTPFTFDTTPLQQYLLNLTKQVEQVQRENASLRSELNDLKVGQRLETLEQSIQELADQQRPGTGYGMPPASMDLFPAEGTFAAQSMEGTARSAATPGGPTTQANQPMLSARSTHSAADAGWILFEFAAVKDRLAQMERKAEALWHVQETDEELRGVVERLKHDIEAVHSTVSDTQNAARLAQHTVEKLEVTSRTTSSLLKELEEKTLALDLSQAKSLEERKDSALKLENNINQIWDQIRHVENSLSQRLTLAETSQVSTLQEVDEVKETANEVMGRVEDVRRHIAALESKLESFNTQVAAAISPLHNSLANVNIKLEELFDKKQDIASAVSMDDVGLAVSRAIDHADRRVDNIIKSIGAMEERVEELNDLKANKSDVVMTTDLQALLTAHAAELDTHLDRLKDEIMKAVAAKADKDELAGLDSKLGARLGGLENAILKGLKAISDKVSAALAEKLDLSRFNEFKVQVRAVLADVEDRLRDWSPAARGMKAPMDAGGNLGASSCLCCDSRVRSVRDLQHMGFATSDKVFSPERLPHTEALLPAITRNPEVAAYHNAKVSHRKKDVTVLLTRSTNSLMETLPAAPGPGSPGSTVGQQLLSSIDPTCLIQPATKTGHVASSKVKVDVETINSLVEKGNVPLPQKSKPFRLKSVDTLTPWENPQIHSPTFPVAVEPPPGLVVDTVHKAPAATEHQP